MVTIHSKQFREGYGWDVNCTVVCNGVRSGMEYVNLPEDATDEAFASAILENYK